MNRKLTFYLIFGLFVVPVIETKKIKATSSQILTGSVSAVSGAIGLALFCILSVILVRKFSSFGLFKTDLQKFGEWLKNAISADKKSLDYKIAESLKNKIGEDSFNKLIQDNLYNFEISIIKQGYEKIYNEYEKVYNEYAKKLGFSSIHDILTDNFFKMTLLDALKSSGNLISIDPDNIRRIFTSNMAKSLLVRRIMNDRKLEYQSEDDRLKIWYEIKEAESASPKTDKQIELLAQLEAIKLEIEPASQDKSLSVPEHELEKTTIPAAIRNKPGDIRNSPAFKLLELKESIRTNTSGKNISDQMLNAKKEFLGAASTDLPNRYKIKGTKNSYIEFQEKNGPEQQYTLHFVRVSPDGTETKSELTNFTDFLENDVLRIDDMDVE